MRLVFVAEVGHVFMAQTLHAYVHASTKSRWWYNITWLSAQQSEWCAQRCFYSRKNTGRITSRL